MSTHIVTATSTPDPESVTQGQSPRISVQRLLVSSAGKNFIQHAEGTRLYYYNDTDYHCTVGVGHLVDLRSCEEIGIPEHTPVSKAQVSSWLDGDIVRISAIVRREIHIPLYQHEWDGLMSLAFNTGSLSIAPHLLTLLNQGNYEAAAHEMLDITNGGDPVLANRRNNEYRLYMTGDYNYQDFHRARQHS